MGKKISIKPRINKANGQITFNLKKKELPKDLLKEILNIKKLKIELGDWE